MTLAVRSPQLLLPGPAVDRARWPVVACDQFTSQPDYWAETDRCVGDAPSTLRLILPEVYLGAGDEARIAAIHRAMGDMLARNLLELHAGPILVERISRGAHVEHARYGVVVEVDLEQYDFARDSKSAVRATEGTIVDRIPPRLRVRAGAALELPHVLLLFDDPTDSVLGPLRKRTAELSSAYDQGLMQGGGHLRGWKLDAAGQDHLFGALAALPGGSAGDAPMQFAVGDGNHSLATARTWWLRVKATLPEDQWADHPARWALVEIENIHDPGLVFEPIHRVLFDLRRDPLADLAAAFGPGIRTSEVPRDRLAEAVAKYDRGQAAGLLTERGAWLVEFVAPAAKLTVATVQGWLDGWLKAGGAAGIDYVHGADVTLDLGSKRGHAGVLLPAIDKAGLFASVRSDGPLPRKTFSMGEAWEKRYYFEARRITR